MALNTRVLCILNWECARIIGRMSHLVLRTYNTLTIIFIYKYNPTFNTEKLVIYHFISTVILLTITVINHFFAEKKNNGNFKGKI